MKTGLLAAEAMFNALEGAEDIEGLEVTEYEEKVKKSKVYSDLYTSRNFKGGFHGGLYLGLLHGFLTTSLTRGKEMWSLKAKHKDSATTEKKEKHKPIVYPPHDGKYTFDLLSNLQRSGTNHNHDQPAHLVVK